jgi:hypothetical protein
MSQNDPPRSGTSLDYANDPGLNADSYADEPGFNADEYANEPGFNADGYANEPGTNEDDEDLPLNAVARICPLMPAIQLNLGSKIPAIQLNLGSKTPKTVLHSDAVVTFTLSHSPPTPNNSFRPTRVTPRICPSSPAQMAPSMTTCPIPA